MLQIDMVVSKAESGNGTLGTSEIQTELISTCAKVISSRRFGPRVYCPIQSINAVVNMQTHTNQNVLRTSHSSTI